MATRTPHRSSALRRIRDITSEIQPKWPYTQISRPRRAVQPASPCADLDTIFPHPRSLTPELEASGIDTNTAHQFSSAYCTAATRLKTRCESLLQKRYQNSDLEDLSHALPLLERTISRRYHSLLRQWKESILHITHTMTPGACASFHTGKHRPAFNQDSVPLLEKYWEYNAYPSQADRAILADKTGLTSRQIEVWFQNHRNRAKKMGKPRTRRDCSANPDDFPWEEIISSLFHKSEHEESAGILPTHTSTSSPDSTPEPTIEPLPQTIQRNCILDIVQRPPHAFPTLFSSSRSLDIEPPAFDEIEWYRHPARRRVVRPVPSLDELCDSLQSGLNLWRRRNATHSAPVEEPPRRWSPATYVTLPPKHHHALLKGKQSERKHSRKVSSTKLLHCYTTRSHSYHPRIDGGFLRYRRQPSTLTGALSIHKSATDSQQLRRRSSASSVDSSTGCPTPISSPSISFIRTQSDDFELPYLYPTFEKYQSALPTYCDVTSALFHPSL